MTGQGLRRSGTSRCWMVGDSKVMLVRVKDRWHVSQMYNAGQDPSSGWPACAGLDEQEFRTRRDAHRAVLAAAVTVPLPQRPRRKLQARTDGSYWCGGWTVTSDGEGGWEVSLDGYGSFYAATLHDAACGVVSEEQFYARRYG